MERLTYYVDSERMGEYGGNDGRHFAPPEGANLYSSELLELDDEGLPLHAPVIDFDVPARLVPSSTPGNSHLYIDVAMSWEKYEALLQALVDAGVVEPGYLGASRERRATFVRMPGFTK